jgi:hypothetical protein
VACEGLSVDEVRQALVGMLPALRDLPGTAAELGVPDKVIEHAIRPDQMIAAIEALEDV